MGIISHKGNMCHLVWKMPFWKLVVGAVGIRVMGI